MALGAGVYVPTDKTLAFYALAAVFDGHVVDFVEMASQF